MTAFNDFHRKMNSKKPSQIKVKDGYPNWYVRIGEKGGAYVYDKHKRKVYLSQLSNKAIVEIGKKDPEMMKKIITLKLDKKNSKTLDDNDEVISNDSLTTPKKKYDGEAVKEDDITSTNDLQKSKASSRESKIERNSCASKSSPNNLVEQFVHLTKAGTPDKRFKANRTLDSVAREEAAARQRGLEQQARDKENRARVAREEAAARQRGLEQQARDKENRARQAREEAAARQRVLEQQARDKENRARQAREEAAARQRVLEQSIYNYSTPSYYSQSFSSPNYYSQSFSTSSNSHDGPRCKDGSLDMRFSVNKGYSKYG